MNIKVLYTSVDRVRIKRAFKTLKMAQRFAHHYVGAHPDMGSYYAVSNDGIGKIEVWGDCTLQQLFPPQKETNT